MRTPSFPAVTQAVRLLAGSVVVTGPWFQHVCRSQMPFVLSRLPGKDTPSAPPERSCRLQQPRPEFLLEPVLDKLKPFTDIHIRDILLIDRCAGQGFRFYHIGIQQTEKTPRFRLPNGLSLSTAPIAAPPKKPPPEVDKVPGNQIETPRSRADAHLPGVRPVVITLKEAGKLQEERDHVTRNRNRMPPPWLAPFPEGMDRLFQLDGVLRKGSIRQQSARVKGSGPCPSFRLRGSPGPLRRGVASRPRPGSGTANGSSPGRPRSPPPGAPARPAGARRRWTCR